MKGRPRRAWKPAVPKHRAPEADRILSDLASIQCAGLRAAVELRGFAEHQLADMLCDVIERVATIQAAVNLRLSDTVEIGGESHG